MPKIVLVEDDADLYALLTYNLQRAGFTVAGSNTGRGAVELCRQERPDLILLDIMLPDADGLSLCRAMRATEELANIPVIFLTARASESDRVLGLEFGASDYIVKPFFVREVIARIKVQLRRPVEEVNVLRAGSLLLDRRRCRVLQGGHELAMTATEFKLLEHFMTRPEVVFSREQLLNNVWGHDRLVTDRTVDVYILRLRQKIEAEPGSPAMIRSVRGFGYSFHPPAPQSLPESA